MLTKFSGLAPPALRVPAFWAVRFQALVRLAAYSVLLAPPPSMVPVTPAEALGSVNVSLFVPPLRLGKPAKLMPLTTPALTALRFQLVMTLPPRSVVAALLLPVKDSMLEN